MKIKHWLAGAALAGWALAAPALELAGVEVPELQKVRGEILLRNGAGIRTAMGFNVYVGALYLLANKHDADEIVGSPTPKRMLLVLRRDLKSRVLLTAFRDGMQLNADDATRDRLKPRIAQFERVFDRIRETKAGDQLALDVGGDGSVDVVFNGKVEEMIPGPDIGPAVLKIWLGQTPVSDELKSALLAATTKPSSSMTRQSAFDSVFEGYSP